MVWLARLYLLLVSAPCRQRQIPTSPGWLARHRATATRPVLVRPHGRPCNPLMRFLPIRLGRPSLFLDTPLPINYNNLGAKPPSMSVTVRECKYPIVWLLKDHR